MSNIKVLQINAGSKLFGGVSAIILNLFRHMGEDVVFDFLTPNISTYSEFKEEIEAKGGTIYDFKINASSATGKIKLYYRLKEFLTINKYDIIHINSGVLLFNYIGARACKKYSDSKIVVHSHNNG